MKIFGSLRITLARQSLYFSPPESWCTSLSILLPIVRTTLLRDTLSSTSSNSSSVASSFAISKLSLILPKKTSGSYPIYLQITLINFQLKIKAITLFESEAIAQIALWYFYHLKKFLLILDHKISLKDMRD